MNDARITNGAIARRAASTSRGDESWDWLLADGECPICGRRHSRWIRRVAAWLGWQEAA